MDLRPKSRNLRKPLNPGHPAFGTLGIRSHKNACYKIRTRGQGGALRSAAGGGTAALLRCPEQHHPNLDDWAGKTVQFRFHFHTFDNLTNDGKGIAIDDMVFTKGCPEVP